MAIQDYGKAIERQDDKGAWSDCLYIGRPLNADVGVNKHWIEFQNDKGAWVTEMTSDDRLRNKIAAVAVGVINVYPDRIDAMEVDEKTADDKAGADRTEKLVVYLVNGQPKVERRPIERAVVDVVDDIVVP